MIPTIAICIATFKRPAGLREMLGSLLNLQIEGFVVHLLVADNDPQESARPQVDSFSLIAPFPVTYVSEPERGIAFVRNRLVAEAYKYNSDFIAFVDDDEIVDPGWLANLVKISQEFNADAVTGPQIYRCDADTPDYIIQCFGTTERQNGQPVRRLSTGNVLLRTNELRQIPGPFDSRFNLIGGSDSMLGETLNARGFNVVWSSDAIVYEHVPASRANAKWILKRGYRAGTNYGLIARTLDPTPRKIARHAADSFFRIGDGVVRMLGSVIFNRKMVLYYARRVAIGVGGLAILVSRKSVYQEYKTTHGQ